MMTLRNYVNFCENIVYTNQNIDEHTSVTDIIFDINDVSCMNIVRWDDVGQLLFQIDLLVKGQWVTLTYINQEDLSQLSQLFISSKAANNM